MIKNKEAERTSQDTEYKPLKTKVLNNTSQANAQTNAQTNVQANAQTNAQANAQTNVQNNYIGTFDDMKRGVVKQKPNDKNYNSILDGLKDLGIIKL